jgi:TonB family protein
MAAGLVGLMIAGVSVPSARAAVFEFVRTVAAEVLPDLFPLEPEPRLPEIEALVPVPVSPEPRTEVVVVSPVGSHEEVEAPNPDLPTISHVETTFPEIISQREAAAMIASRYPRELQEAGVEGSVKLQFWVGEEGALENIQIREGSGSQQLDYVAMRSARELKFRPATRNGVPVGTWVEVNIHFFALAGTGIIGPDSMDSGM